ncbi:tetratricopeptide repeat protein [Mobilisporobacter senegalensis]|uniref:Tetratricopeptide repeat protein n=1 Tax=Mobilisporobacter senegalensis TaxID=1329262 RepID=A0A3N1XNP3_9FIRM|nr:tetratricopeptide repeat protein [Mobilisporobacter senegalensis]ROR28266.1 tetratricopeptide repeat protein [Mobilisporobacter senegalensis]
MRKNSLGFIIIIWIIMLTGCSFGNSANSYHKTGMKYFEKGEYSKAVENLKEAVKLNQGKAEYFIDYGFGLVKTGQVDEALAEFDKAILNKNNKVVRENNKKAYRGKGVAYYEGGEYENAIVEFSKALEIKEEDKLNQDLMYYIASSYEKSGNYKDALNQYEKILDEFKPNAGIYELIARTNYHLGEFEKAIESYDKALEFDKDVYEYYFEKYAIFNKMGEVEAGKKVLSKAAQIKAKSKENDFNGAKLLFLSGDYEKAAVKFNESLEDGFNLANYYLGEIYRIEEDYDLAIQYYKEYLNKESDIQISLVYNQLAACLIANENYEEALGFLNMGIKQNDSSTLKELLYNQVIAYENLSSFKEAYGTAEKYLKLYPDDKEMMREFEFIKTRVTESKSSKEK